MPIIDESEHDKGIGHTIENILGIKDQDVIKICVDCIEKNYDKAKISEKLKNVTKGTDELAEKVVKLKDYYKFKKHGQKRKKEDGKSGRRRAKKFKEDPDEEEEEEVAVKAEPAEGTEEDTKDLDADKIKQLMANARKMIAERKAALNIQSPSPVAVRALMDEETESARRRMELQARIRSQIQNVGLIMVKPNLAETQGSSTAPAPVIMDKEGRVIDALTGKMIKMEHYTPSLKANARLQKRENLSKHLNEKPQVSSISEPNFFDNRLSVKAAVRQKRDFNFIEKGQYERVAQQLRTKAQLEKLQNEIAHAAKRTGIAEATKLATIAPRSKELEEMYVPEVEWWDALILRDQKYYDYDEEQAEAKLANIITNLVEHPIQMKTPGESTKAVEIPLYLTKKERKKVRRQNRLANQKEQQEKIRIGLLPPPEPKVKMANLMRVLGSEAVQDPTKVEQFVRAQMLKRQKAHLDANKARQLTKSQKTEKKLHKIKEDVQTGVHVSVFKVIDLSHPAHKFKVEMNCKQLLMTGFVALFKDCNVVVVEGGPKQQKKFRHLMLDRVKWSDDPSRGEKSKKRVANNSCTLVWEGVVKERCFGEIIFKMCPTEVLAREQFRKHGVEHYWDLAFRTTVLESND